MMNTFGKSIYGMFTAVRLNCKLTREEALTMSALWGQYVTVTEIGKGLTRIEGCMPSRDYSDFHLELTICRKKSKLARMQAEIDSLEDMHATCVAAADDPIDCL